MNQLAIEFLSYNAYLLRKIFFSVRTLTYDNSIKRRISKAKVLVEPHRPCPHVKYERNILYIS